MSNIWISTAETVRLVEQIMNPHMAQVTICRRASEGLINTRAALLVVREEVKSDIELPKEFWKSIWNHGLTQNWKIGDFQTFIERSEHWKAFGVSFARNGIDAIIGPMLASQSPPSVPSTQSQGRPPASWWDDLWIEICRQLWAGDLKPNRQSDVEKAMLDWAASQGHDPGTSTIRPRARKLWVALSKEDEK